MDAALLDSLSRCYPFHQIDKRDTAPLLKGVECRRFARGQTLLRRSGGKTEKLTYLVSGTAELRRSFFDRTVLTTGQAPALQPLDELLQVEGGQIVAVEPCQTVQIARDLLDRSMAAGSPQDFGTSHYNGSVQYGGSAHYGVTALEDSDLTEEFLISDGEVEVDWMSRFLQSSLAQHLPALSIQQLLSCLAARDVEKGEVIVRRGEVGDALYVVTRGMALVRTDSQSPFKGREFSLIPGDYFGEEALVADTLRNATVIMEAAGSVARLDREAFDELVRPHLIRAADDAALERALMAGVNEKLVVVDVRFPVEYRRDALPASLNIPISILRSRMSGLDVRKQVLVTNQGGRRSELAVFLLRQAGFDAFLMPPPGHHFTQVDVARAI